MGSVNTSEIRSLVEDVKSNIGVFNSYVDAAIKCSNEVKAKAEILKSYNDKIVSDSEVIDNVFDEGGVFQYQEYRCKKWAIRGVDSVTASCNALVTEFDLVNGTFEKIITELSNIDVIADVIDGYIKSIQDKLSGVDVSDSDLSSSFQLLTGLKGGFSKFAYSEEDVNNGKFIPFSELSSSIWNDKNLIFTKQEDGSYMVVNSSGEIIGFVSAFATATYLNNLSGSIDGKNQAIYETFEGTGIVIKTDEKGKKTVQNAGIYKGSYLYQEVNGSLVVKNNDTGEIIRINTDGTVELQSTWTGSGENGKFVITQEGDKLNTKYMDTEVVVSSTQGLNNVSKIEDLGIYKEGYEVYSELKDGSVVVQNIADGKYTQINVNGSSKTFEYEFNQTNNPVYGEFKLTFGGNTYDLTSDERNKFIAIVACEYDGETFDEAAAVATSIVNRIEGVRADTGAKFGGYGGSVLDVISASGQYSTWNCEKYRNYLQQLRTGESNRILDLASKGVSAVVDDGIRTHPYLSFRSNNSIDYSNNRVVLTGNRYSVLGKY